MALENIYEKSIDRDHPVCVLILVDQSRSMMQRSGHDASVRKCDGVASAVNSLLYNLTLACSAGDEVREYMHVGVIGYGDSVESRLPGTEAAKPLLSISELAGAVLRTETRARVLSDGVEQKYSSPVWFDAVAGGVTPMCKAFRLARAVVKDFLLSRSDSFPPVVINITDGESTDGNPSEHGRRLTGMSSTNGNVLLLNVHVSSSEAPAVAFPVAVNELSDRFSRSLFEMSSSLPDIMVARARECSDYRLEYGARGFIFNGGMSDVAQMLDIGTRSGISELEPDNASF